MASQPDNASKLAVRSRPDRDTTLICLLLALAVWIVFGQTLKHEFINFDDDFYVYQNSIITQGLTLNGIAWVLTHRHGVHWHPLTSLSHMLDCEIHGLNPGGHHLTNVMIHTATVLLLFLVLRNLTGAFWRSAFVAAVFGIHPLRVESVAWVAERKDVLSGLFFVITLGAYARYVRRLDEPRRSSTNVPHSPAFLTSRDYWLVVLLFTLGLLSKPMLVTLPFVLMLLDYWPLNRLAFSTIRSQPSSVKPLLWEKLPFLLLSAIACLVAIQAQETVIMSVQELGFWSRIGNMFVSYTVYLGQMFYPVGLAVFYPHPGNKLSIWAIGLCVVVVGLITVGVVRAQRNSPSLLVGWLWYLGMLVPVIGLVQVANQARADRYTYLSQVGLCIMLAWGVVDLCGTSRWRRVTLSTAVAMILTALLVLAQAQTRYWRNSISLWTHALSCTSENFFACNNLAASLANQGKLNEAIPYFERALQFNPDSAEAHNSLGFALGQQGRWNEAIPHFERAALLKPNYGGAHQHLGYALAQQQNWTEAIPHFERALQLNPNDAVSHNDLGVVLGQQGKWKEAISHFERALYLKPDYVEANKNLALAWEQQRK